MNTYDKSNDIKKLYLNFPAILQNHLNQVENFFPEDTLFEYEPINCYRAVQRKDNDKTPINRDDFRSNAEKNRKVCRGHQIDINQPEYYGVSCFLSKTQLKNKVKFPNLKIAKGKIRPADGPVRHGKDEHVCWWLFEKAEINFYLYDDEVEI